VVLFDGDCGLCDRVVRFLLWADRARALRFAPLGGPTALGLGEASGAPYQTLVVHVDGRRVERSEAVLLACSRLAWPWRAAAALRIVPLGWRDAVYRLVARHRRRLFGGPEACRLPRGGSAGAWSDRLLP
jgi:predicted DCC family thiol-disulfide oxidoreductase YuxK